MSEVEPAALHHSVVFVDSKGALCRSMAENAKQGIDRAEPLLVAADQETRRGIERLLGSSADSIRFVDADVLYVSPQSALHGLLAFLHSQSPLGESRLRVITTRRLEPQPQPEWIRYEAAVNEIFAGLPATGVCCYDTRGVPPETLRGLERTHHSVAYPFSKEARSRYVEPRQVTEELPTRVLHPSRPPDIVLEAVSEVRGVRTTAVEMAPGHRAHDVAMVVNELTALALSNSGAPQVRMWRQATSLVVQVVGAEAFDDPFAGLRPPRDEVTAALWIACHLADDLVFDRSARSATIVFSS